MKYQHTAHLFHAIMTFVTGGFWLIIWLACWAMNEQHNKDIDRQRQSDRDAADAYVKQWKGWMNK